MYRSTASSALQLQAGILFIVGWLLWGMETSTLGADAGVAPPTAPPAPAPATATTPKPAPAFKSQLNADRPSLFTDGKVRRFRLTVKDAELTALQKDNRNYVRATFTDGHQTLSNVALRLKGMGSFRPLNEKPSFSVKFDRYTPHQVYAGLSKFMLNNASQDNTYLAEYIATQMFRDAGVPASHVTHAFVEFNGRPLGLYVLVEAMNKDFLKQHFESTKGNLYEAYLADIDSVMDQDGGTTNTDQADRKQLVEIVQIKDPLERWKRLQDVFEVDRYLAHLVIELFTSHTDGYAMNRNNYRLYHDPSTGRFTMIAHGIDWAYSNIGVSIQPPRSSLLTKAVLQTPMGWRRFKELRGQLFTNTFQVPLLTNRVQAAAVRLVAAAHTPDEAREFQNGATEMCNRIVARAANIAQQLAVPEPLPLAFDSNGVARPTAWAFKKDRGEVVSDQPLLDGKTTLHLRVGQGDCIGSWRSKILLEEGHYRFQGLARIAQVTALTNKVEQGNGVGLRISGEKRTNQLTGDLAWTIVQHDFEVTPGGEEKELVCELRARQGEVWFDATSLRLIRK